MCLSDRPLCYVGEEMKEELELSVLMGQKQKQELADRV